MPHMMPMMWIMIYSWTLLTFYISLNMLYFLNIPNMNSKKIKLNQIKWTWMW